MPKLIDLETTDRIAIPLYFDGGICPSAAAPHHLQIQIGLQLKDNENLTEVDSRILVSITVQSLNGRDMSEGY
jgi:hypothetical protein